ncbi:MAG: nucleotidyltransferase family protein [Desulfohalobiaceae bacterium]|nr:nucleotidyltransferase family protein [Desulfohalobiaceae bacterium]
MENKVTTKEELIKRILEQRERLLFLGVTSIGLFGSFVRGEQTDSSDIDILVEFTPEKHAFDNFMDVSFLLEDTLGRKVEVVTPEGLSPHIGPHILKEVERVPVTA